MFESVRSLLLAMLLVASLSGATISHSTSPAARVTQVASVMTGENSTTTTTSKPEAETSTTKDDGTAIVQWECPNITSAGIECSCDFPHTLRCIGDKTSLQAISTHLRHSRPGMISLLDVTVSGISTLPASFLEDVALHGLVVSTGELRRVHENAFTSLARPLQALGLPNNLLDSVPTIALAKLVGLERLDLSHNKLKTLAAGSFQDLTFAD